MSPRLVLIFSALTSLGLATPPTAPTHLRVNDVVDPVGTSGEVYFGWQVNDPDPDEIQSRYQLLVASSAEKLAADIGDVRDGGQVVSRQQSHVSLVGTSFSSDTRYHWKVRTWDRAGEVGAWSAPAVFDVGLQDNPDWSGAFWIKRDTQDADDYTRFRRRFELPPGQPIVRATAYVSAVHQYTLHLNGTPAGKGQAYHYPQYQYYRAYDVTALLRAGEANQLAIFTHWFGGGQGRPASARGLLFKLVVHHADGSVTTLGTDATWRQSRAEAWELTGLAPRNRGEGVGYVERIDARRLEAGWTGLEFDDSSWTAAAVVGPHPTPPWTGVLAPELTRITERLIAPTSISAKGDGKYVIDLGRVWTGVPRLRFSGGTPGGVVAMRGGYVLDANGEIPPDTKSQSTLMEYRATLSGEDFTYEPVEYLGLRYYQIDNAPMPVTAESFAFLARHSRLDDSASDFASPDPTLNAVWALMKHSLFTCAQEEFVDTPTREKGGFLGDSVIQSSVAMPVLAERTLTQRTLREFLQSMEQHWAKPADLGRINAVYPNNDGARDIPDFTQAYLIWAWTYYQETGDHAFLANHYPHLKAIADYVARHLDPATGLVTRLTGGKGAYEYGIVDWPATMRYGYDMATAARTVINGWAYADFTTLAQIADTLGYAADRDTYRARADALATAINTRLLRADGVYHDGLHADGTPSPHASQHANLFPLALGIVPPTHRATVIAHLRARRMSVGMVTLPWLLRALGTAGQGSALLDLFTDPSQPGWARSLSRGATATWESWDADATDQSLSHAWGAAGLEGYYRYILGLRPLRPQYEEVLIHPLDFGDRLPWAKGRITTERGPLSVHWLRDTGSYTLRLTLPVNVSARLVLPRGSAPSPVVHLDGVPVTATTEGDTLVVTGVGSGEHTLVRYDTAPAAPLEPATMDARIGR